MQVKIITDVISDISPVVAQEYGIEIMPIQITMDGETRNASDIPIKELVEWIEANKKLPSFKGVSCDEYEKAYHKYINQGYEIVCLTAGSKAISNFDCALYASTKFPDNNIQVIDTNRYSGNVGLLAVLAAKMALNGASANEIAIVVERSLDKNRQTALVTTNGFIKYSSPEEKVVSEGINMLNTRPAAMEKAVNNFCNKVFKNIESVKPEVLFLTYTDSDKDYISQVYQRAAQLEYFEDIVLCKSSHFNTSFVGLNSMAAAYQMK